MIDIEIVSLPGGAVDLHDARRNRRWSAKSEPFEIAVFPVTQEQFAILSEGTLGERRPVSAVSWRDAAQFCNSISDLAGLASAYEFDGATVTWNTSAPGYRLPTEAEREYACRAGTSGPHYGPLKEVAWTSEDDVDAPQPVGMKAANGFGLHDMLGNVWEWCWDYLDPARYGDYRVFRGGGYADQAWSVRASTRGVAHRA